MEIEKKPEEKPEIDIAEALEAIRPIIAPAGILQFQQLVRKCERVSRDRQPAVSDVEGIAAEVMRVMLVAFGLTSDDMVREPVVIAGMAQMLLLMIDAMPKNEKLALHDPAALRATLKVMIDAAVLVQYRAAGGKIEEAKPLIELLEPPKLIM